MNSRSPAGNGFGKRSGEVNRDAAGTVLPALSPLAVDTAFGYTGADWDGDVGLTNHDARWYDSSTGRWLSQDPSGLGPDPNPYRYVRNQPTTLADPSGLEPPQSNTIEVEPGVRIIPRSPLLGDLNTELRENYLLRGLTGCLVFPRFGDNGVKTRDDGYFENHSATSRGDFLVDYAVSIGIPEDGQFHTVTVPKWTNIYGYVKKGSMGDFWISTPHTLDAAGTYEIRLEGPITIGAGKLQNATVRNVDLTWRLTDRVDANSIPQFTWRGGGVWQVLGGCVEVTVGDLVGDKLLGAGYDVEIYVSQKESWERPASGQVR